MMQIDIRKLNAQKKYIGSMEFECSVAESFIQIPFVKFSGPVKVKFDYELYEDDSLEVQGTVSMPSMISRARRMASCSCAFRGWKSDI